jgi:hypothetical protein
VKGWLLDTNVIAALISPNGAPSVKQWAAAQDEALFHISVLTIGEYEKGIANLDTDDPRRLAYSSVRDRLLERFSVRVLPVSDAVVRRWGTITGTVRRLTGHPPPVIDTLLAATALEADLCLVTRNIRDVADSGATLFNPWNDGAHAPRSGP